MLRWILDLFSPHKRPGFELPGDAELRTAKGGLRYKVVREGAPDGRRPRTYDQVEVRYAGWTTDGRLFDASYPRSVTFSLDRVIKGWSQGLQLMREGDAYLLVVPPDLAYGPRGVPPRIGPDATLVFHVELVRVKDLYTA